MWDAVVHFLRYLDDWPLLHIAKLDKRPLLIRQCLQACLYAINQKCIAFDFLVYVQGAAAFNPIDGRPLRRTGDGKNAAAPAFDAIVRRNIRHDIVKLPFQVPDRDAVVFQMK